MNNNQRVCHCGQIVNWIGNVPYDRGTIQHYCQAYLDELRKPFGQTTRRKPVTWMYVPATVAEQKLGRHFVWCK